MQMRTNLQQALAAAALTLAACSSPEGPRPSLTTTTEAVSGSGGSSGASSGGTGASSGGSTGGPGGGSGGGGGAAQGGFPGGYPNGRRPRCDEASKDQRVQDEANLTKQLASNHCLPNNLEAEPCKSLYDQWEAIKNDNAYCNAKEANVAVCDYYLAMVRKYKDLLKNFCPPPSGHGGDLGPSASFKQLGLTYQDFCDMAAVSLRYFKFMASVACGHSWCDATRRYEFIPDDAECTPLGGLCCYPHDGCYHVGSDGAGTCSSDLGC
jgi:hypothetical protein